MSPALGTLWRTLRPLRARQVAGQLRLRLAGRPRPRAHRGPAPALVASRAAVPFLPSPPHAFCDGGRRFRLRHREVAFADRIDWDFAGEGPLWAYDLHSFEWLRRPALAPAARAALVRDWMSAHRRGVGWEGHPLSLRTVAWIKCLLTPGALPADPTLREAMGASLASQLDTLAAGLETHLLANHYLSNLLALVFAGLVFEGSAADRWLAHERALRGELAAQVGADGLHEERSPMYHALLLETVLDLVNVARAGGRASDALAADLADAAARMRGALDVLVHPDGEIALFADSALGVAQPPAALAGYAEALGVAPRPPERAGVLDAGGYLRLAAGPFTLLASVAGPMPPHQPGHAHCDALAFELSLGRERVVTDTGVHEYIPGRLRDLSRATRSHATLEVGGHDQAELWGAHRVGGRPTVALEGVEEGKRATASCAGWATPDTRHVRVWELSEDALVVHDRLEGAPRAARLALPLAPGLEPRLDGARARVRLAGGAWLRFDLEGGPALRVERAPYFPEFGRRIERAVLVAEADPWPRTTLRITAARSGLA